MTLVDPVAVLARPKGVQPTSGQLPAVQAATAPQTAAPETFALETDSPELARPEDAARESASQDPIRSELIEPAHAAPESSAPASSDQTPGPAPSNPEPSNPVPAAPGPSELVPILPESSEETDPAPAWLDSQRLIVARGMGGLIDRFDRFFGDDRQLDAESPSTRLRLKTFGRTAQDRDFSWGGGAAVSVHLPRLQRWFGNARLVLAGENTSSAVPLPPASDPLPDGEPSTSPPAVVAPTDLSRSRGRAELRFDVIRRGVLVFDTGAGVTFAWPPVPFARFRAHLRLALPAGLVLRATEILFVELGGRGAGTSTDLLVERFLGASLRLRWEGHTVFAQKTRGAEWSTVTGAEWMVHRRTGLYGGVDAFGFGTPQAGLESWRTFVGVRQDLRGGWVFAELEPELGWPRPPGQPRREVLAITLRLQVVIDSRPSVVGAASAPTQAR